LWRYTLFEQPKHKRAQHSYIPGYTKKQRAKLLQMMDELLEETQDTTKLYHECPHRTEIANRTIMLTSASNIKQQPTTPAETPQHTCAHHKRSKERD
jgi:hypothetical protein